jgi:hypothetical protein
MSCYEFTVLYDSETDELTIGEFKEIENDLPPVINDCKSCGYSAPMSDKLYVDKFTHPLVYCRHHEVICVADRKPCEWAMRGEKKSP